MTAQLLSADNLRSIPTRRAAHRREPERLTPLGTLVLLLGAFLPMLDFFIVNVALGDLQRDLHAGPTALEWVVAGYGLTFAVLLLAAGRLGDRLGRRRLLGAGVALFTLASLMCGLAPSAPVLIGARLLQGAGGALISPTVLAFIGVLYQGAARARAIGRYASAMGLAAAGGQLVGGLLLYADPFGLGWRIIFLVNVPIGIALIVLGTIFIPVSARTPDQRLDLRSVALLGATLLPAMFGIAWLGNGSSVTSPAFLIPECAAAISLVAFVRHSARAASPFIRIRYLAGHGFGVMNLLNFLYGSSVLGFGALIPLYAHDRYGLAILAGGTLLTARGAGMIATSGVTVFLLRRTGYRWPILAGFSLTAAGLLLTAISPAGLPPYGWLAVAAAVCGIGMGISTPAANNATLQLAPDQAAALAGLRAMFRQTGSITAVSVTTAIVARSADPGITQAHIFTIFAIILVATMPLILRVPDHHGRW